MPSFRRRAAGGFVDYFGHQGGQDSLVRLVDQAGNVAERYEWDAYGTATVYAGEFPSQLTVTAGATWWDSDDPIDRALRVAATRWIRN